MKKLVALFVVLFGFTYSQAAELSVVHGVNGTDLGLAEALPVDISLSGSCALKNVPFRTVSSTLQVAAGSHEVVIRLSNGNCTGALVAQTRLDLSINENSTIVAHLSEEGAVRLTKFINDRQPTANNLGRVTLRHTAAAPAVDIWYRARRASRVVRALRSGEQNGSETIANSYNFIIYTSSPRRQALPNVSQSVEANQQLIVYVVGSAKKGSLSLITQRLGL